MTNIKASTPSASAASPSHPDHARWVKERTLKVEAEWATNQGLTARDAEATNAANLDRLEGRKRFKKPSLAVAKADGLSDRRRKRKEEREAVGVFVRPAKAIRPVAARTCNFCGMCRQCKREKRVVLIMTKAREGDECCLEWTWQLTSTALAAKAKQGKFAGLKAFDLTRAVNRQIEEVCDRSIHLLGDWR